MILRDQEIDSAVVVVVSGNDGARLFELNLVESNVDGDVFPSAGTKIAEEADFALAVFRLADSDEIDPPIVVVVDSGDALGNVKIRLRERHGSKTLSAIVMPKR